MIRTKALGVVAFICLAAVAVKSEATMISANIGALTRMWVYSTYGTGDVQFIGTTPGGSCQQFWLRGTDDGFKNMYALLLAARATQRPVLVYAYDDQLWTGSAIPTCRVDAIDFAD